jgi:hypothetical protein
VLHGLGLTCTEYLIRALGTSCFNSYNWNDKSNIITSLDDEEMSHVITYLKQLTDTDGVKPVVRIPMTATYWLGISTESSKDRFEKYPDIGSQYQTLIGKMVDAFTAEGIVVILDLHNSDDDTKN